MVLNAGAYTHTSIALADAIAGGDVRVIEVHISNVHRREAFRHHSYVSPLAAGIIVGLGTPAYPLGPCTPWRTLVESGLATAGRRSRTPAEVRATEVQAPVACAESWLKASAADFGSL